MLERALTILVKRTSFSQHPKPIVHDGSDWLSWHLLEMIMQLDHRLSIVPKYIVDLHTYIEGASPAEVELEFEGIYTLLRNTKS